MNPESTKLPIFLISLPILLSFGPRPAAAEPAADCPAIHLPSGFTTQPSSHGKSVDVSLESEGGVFAKVVSQGETSNGTRNYELYDGAQKLVAKASASYSEDHRVLQVSDCNGKPVGKIDERFFDGPMPDARYELRDAQDRLLAQTGKEYFLEKSIALKAPSAAPNVEPRKAVEISRPFFSLALPKWEVKDFPTDPPLDPRLSAFFLAFKLDLDSIHDDRKRKESSGS